MAAAAGRPLPPVSPRASRELPALFKRWGGHFPPFAAAMREARGRWVRARSASAAIRGAGAVGAMAARAQARREERRRQHRVVPARPAPPPGSPSAGKGLGRAGGAARRGGGPSGAGCVAVAGEGRLGSGAGGAPPTCGSLVGARVQNVCRGAGPSALLAAELGEGGRAVCPAPFSLR